MDWYPHHDIEKKWQERWLAGALGKAEDFSDKPKAYLLFEFPYPSGAGLHVGHLRPYTALDVIARKQRMEGKNVLFPIGWDAFGLPTENYALKTGIHPRVATDQNIATFRRQMQAMGLSLDWSREIDTTDPAYYKWTQWIFLQFFKKGLAYQATMPINWCPKDKIGLANEEVVNGKCERCGTEVTRKEQKQWMLKITAYADRLIDDLADVAYPDRVKAQQINWIGRSEGAEITFQIASSELQKEKPNFILLHGYTGQADKNFFPWLKAELEQKGYKVQVPQLPNSKEPKEDEQVSYVLSNCAIDENTVMVGHSLGAEVAMKALVKHGKKIKGLVLVAAVMPPKFSNRKTPRNYWNTFSWDADYQKVKKLASTITLLSDTQESHRERYIEFLRDQLDAQFISVQAAKEHFTSEQEPSILENITPTITVFTTRPDTIFGATYMVLAPEHSLVSSITTDEQRSAVEKYRFEIQKKSDLERTDLAKEKTGVFTGAYAINPATKEQIPIWIADYVLASYGTGAIMAVPAHDERDYEFAKKFDLPIKEVVIPDRIDEKNPPVTGKKFVERKNIHAIIRNPKTDKYLCLVWKKHPWITFPMGGVEDGEDVVTAAQREVEEETGYTNLKFVKVLGGQIRAEYFAAHKDENRIAYTQAVMFDLVDETKKAVKQEEADAFDLVWYTKDEITYPKVVHVELKDWLERWNKENDAYVGEGVLVNSGKFDGTSSTEAIEKITKWLEKEKVGKKAISFKLRDWVFSRQHYWGEPIPIIHCPDHGAVAVPEKDLPVELPYVEKYEPSGTGESPLATIPEFVNTTCPECGKPAKRETDTMPNWAGSSWYYLRYCDPKNTEAFADKKKLDYWLPVDLYNGGMEHTTLHLLYSRFWHKFLFDLKLVPNPEPYAKRTSHGVVLAENSEKMSKSRGNVINPDALIKEYGADSVRTYEMFMGPFEDMIPWSNRGIVGVHRFLQNVHDLFQGVDEPGSTSEDPAIVAEIEYATHYAIKHVGADIDSMRFNTAVSTLMQFVNTLRKQEQFRNLVAYKKAQEVLLILLAPLAPHLASELWEKAYGGDIATQSWPSYDEKKLVRSEITLVVQVNGKVRAKLVVPADIQENDAQQRAMAEPNVAKFVPSTPKKVVFVAGKLINFII